MELKVFLTYIGLLFTAYNVNPEYRKLQIELSSIIWKVLFVITLILLFLSSNEIFKEYLLYTLDIKCYIYNWIWISKYHLIVVLNVFSLYKIFTASQLSKNNSKIFFELIKNLEVEKKYDLKSKVIKNNLENIFKYKNHQTFLSRLQNKIYNLISPSSNYLERIEKDLTKISQLQKDYLDNGGDINKLNEIEQLPNTKYTKIEKFRELLAKLIKPKSFQNYFSEVYNLILDKKFIKYILKNDEQFGLEILRYIAQYGYFIESYQYIEYFLKKTLSNKNSLVFKLLYENKENIKFIIENQQYENGFDLGLIVCETIENLVIKNKKELQKVYSNNNENKVYKHISNLYKILGELETDKMHLAGTPYYIQIELIKLIDFSEKQENQNLAFQLLLKQLDTMKDLSLKTKGNYFIEHNFDDLLEESFKIENINEDLVLEIALYYSDYIFDKFTKIITVENKVESFKNFIDKTNNQFIILVYLKVFNKYRSYNGKDYISYTKIDKNLQQYWNEIYTFLKAKED